MGRWYLVISTNDPNEEVELVSWEMDEDLAHRITVAQSV